MTPVPIDLLVHTLVRRGFTRSVEGLFTRDSTTARIEPGWVRLEVQDPTPRGVEACRQCLATQPAGPWKVSPSGRVADLPLAAAVTAQDRGHVEDCMANALDWLLATATDIVPVAWRPPTATEVERYLPGTERTVRCGSDLRAIDLVASGSGLRLSCPLADGPAMASLSGARHEWLVATLWEWQEAGRMVRVSSAAPGVAAEVDVSGAPADLIEPLLLAGRDCLRATIPLVLPLCAVLCAPDISLVILESYRLSRRRVAASEKQTAG